MGQLTNTITRSGLGPNIQTVTVLFPHHVYTIHFENLQRLSELVDNCCERSGSQLSNPVGNTGTHVGGTSGDVHVIVQVIVQVHCTSGLIMIDLS